MGLPDAIAPCPVNRDQTDSTSGRFWVFIEGGAGFGMLAC